MVNFSENWRSVDFNEIVSLYNSVGWNAYTKNKESLLRAFENSSYILIVTEGEDVVAALRSLSDDVSIHYLQDILVRPSHQHKGIGRSLLDNVLNRYSHVRTYMLLTDDEEKQMKFYTSLGYENLKTYKKGTLNSFVRMNS
jgi:ribosomal protein S18 acetylase RimI-like enzyme